MVDLVVSYGATDRAAGERVVASLQRAGYDVAVDRDATGWARRTDEVATEMRRAAAFVPLLSSKSLRSQELRQSVRVALFYDKPIVAVRLDLEAQPEDLGSDMPVIVGTRFEERPEDLVDMLARTVDLSAFAETAAADAAETREPGLEPAPLGPDLAARRARDVGAQPLLTELQRRGFPPRGRGPIGVVAAATATAEPTLDGLGFPKTPETMLARWRLIETSGTVKDFEQFETDYEDDPFFATLAAENAADLKRKRMLRIVDLGVRGVVGSIFAGMILLAATAYCGSGACGPSARPGETAASGVDPSRLAAARQETQRLQREIERLRDSNQQLQASLRDAETALERRGGSNPQIVPSQSGDQRLRAQLAEAQNQLARIQQELRARDERIARLEADANEARRRYAQVGDEIARRDRQIAALQTEIEQASRGGVIVRSGGGGVAAVSRSLPDGGTDSGMERILGYYADRYTDERRARRFRENPVFTSSELRLLQACLLKRTGKISSITGRWGRETTSALLATTQLEAGWVIDCVASGGKS